MKKTKHILKEELVQFNVGSSADVYGHKTGMDDLDYLAASGFEKTGLTADDVIDVKKRIDAHTFRFSNLNSIFTGGMIAVAFTSAFIAIVNNEQPEMRSENQQKIFTQTLEHTIDLPEVLVSSPSAVKEKQITIKAQQWTSEHFASQNPEEIADEFRSPEVEKMATLPVKSLSMRTNEDIRYDQLPNAPVVYIEGLKVTNFQLYYFRNDKRFEIINGGFEAEFGDKQDYLSKNNEMKHNTPAITAVDLLQEALECFNGGNYSGCISEMDLLLKLNEGDVNALFYSAMSFRSVQKNRKAIEYFDKVLSNPNNIFHQEAEFYKAITLLDSGDRSEARELFHNISEEKGFYAERAKELLKKIK